METSFPTGKVSHGTPANLVLEIFMRASTCIFLKSSSCEMERVDRRE